MASDACLTAALRLLVAAGYASDTPSSIEDCRGTQTSPAGRVDRRIVVNEDARAVADTENDMSSDLTKNRRQAA